MIRIAHVYGLPLLLLLLTGQLSLGQDIKQKRFHFELEPLQFINSGWSVVGHYSINERLQIGTNVFSSELADGQNDLAFDFPGDVDLLAEQDLGINISVRFFLKKQEVQQGWVISLPIGWENWTLTDESNSENSSYQFWYLSPRIGYLWYPFKRNSFYVLGEAVGILPIIQDDDVVLNGNSISVNSFIPFPGLGLGFSF